MMFAFCVNLLQHKLKIFQDLEVSIPEYAFARSSILDDGDDDERPIRRKKKSNRL